MPFTDKQLTDWTENDPDGVMTIAGGVLTATIGSNTPGTLHRQFPIDTFDGWRHRMRLKMSNGTTDAFEVLVWGITRELLSQTLPAIFTSWPSGVKLTAYKNGSNYYLKIADITSATNDTSSALTAGTDYYLEIRRHYKHVDVVIFSDSAFSSVVDTISLTAISGIERWSAHYLLCGTKTTPYEGIGDPSSWDKLDETWAALTGWSTAGTGTNEINPAGSVHCIPNANSYRVNYKTLAAWASTKFTVETRDYYDSIGTYASGNVTYFTIRDSVHLHDIAIATNGVWAINSAGSYVQVASTSTSASTWYTTRYIIDSDNHTVVIERKADGGSWAVIASWTSLRADATSAGYVLAAGMWRGASGNSEIHREYTKIAAGRYYNIDPGGATSTIDIEIGNVQFSDIPLSDHIFIGKFLPGIIENDCETYPNGFTDSVGSGCTLERSAAWKKSGTYSWHAIGSGANRVGAYKSFTAAVIDRVHQVNLTFRLSSLSDGHTARICYLKNTVNGKIEQAGITRSGANYYWSITKYNGSAWSQTLSRFDVALDTDYEVTLMYNPSSLSTNLYIDGVLVLQTVPVATLGYPNELGMLSAGGEASYPGTYECYVDDVWFGMDFLVFPTLCQMADGNLCVAANYQEQHGGNVRNSLKIFTLDRATLACTLAQTIPAPGAITLYVQKLVAVGSSMYMFCQREGFVSGANLRTTVYKSANDSVNFTSVCTRDADGIFATDLVEDGHICCAACYYYAPYPYGMKVTNVWFDTATDTFDADKGLIANLTTITDREPNETTFYRVPGSNALRAVVRFDHMGQADRFIAYADSADNGTTWGAFTRPTHFERSGGLPKAVRDTDLNGEELVWMSLYRSADPANAATSLIIQARPSDMEILNEKSLGIAGGGIDNEPGNGDCFITSEFPRKDYHWIVDNGSARYYRSAILQPAPGGFPVVRRLQRMRRAA